MWPTEFELKWFEVIETADNFLTHPNISIIHSWWRAHVNKNIRIWINWIAGANCLWWYAWLYKNVVSCFLKESHDCETSVKWMGNAFRTDPTLSQTGFCTKLEYSINRHACFRFSFEGVLQAIYAFDRGPLECEKNATICMFRDPQAVLKALDVEDAKFYLDFIYLGIFFFGLRTLCYFVLKWRVRSHWWKSAFCV